MIIEGFVTSLAASSVFEIGKLTVRTIGKRNEAKRREKNNAELRLLLFGLTVGFLIAYSVRQ